MVQKLIYDYFFGFKYLCILLIDFFVIICSKFNLKDDFFIHWRNSLLKDCQKSEINSGYINYHFDDFQDILLSENKI